MPPTAGRYAPSPSGPLHVGNLRTAALAWAAARHSGRQFRLRVEDLDPHRTGAADQQLWELEQIGLDWDGPVVYQSQRLDLYHDALDRLNDHLFPCFCSRRDIREAASAPHVLPGHYPGTCLGLDAPPPGWDPSRTPARRWRPTAAETTIHDRLHGDFTGPVDAVVLQRGDEVFAYNLAVVVDDVEMGVDQVVRGGDLLGTSPAQAQITAALGGPVPEYWHVPMVLNPAGQRLAKRDGAVTWEELSAQGWTLQDLWGQFASSTGQQPAASAAEFLANFNPDLIPTTDSQFSEENGLRPQADPAHR